MFIVGGGGQGNQTQLMQVSATNQREQCWKDLFLILSKIKILKRDRYRLSVVDYLGIMVRRGMQSTKILHSEEVLD